jgi:hypothetical protein
MAWVFHAAINICGTLFFPGDEPQQWWFAGAGFALAALLRLHMDQPGGSTVTFAQPKQPRTLPSLKDPTRRP